MRRHHAYLTFFLLALCLQPVWLFSHIPFPPLASIHGTSYRSAERHAALYEWSRHPNETTKAILDEEEARAERYEWFVSITSLIAFIAFDVFCIRYLRRQPLDRPTVVIILFIATLAASILVIWTWWASRHLSVVPTVVMALSSTTILVLLWHVLSRQRRRSCI